MKNLISCSLIAIGGIMIGKGITGLIYANKLEKKLKEIDEKSKDVFSIDANTEEGKKKILEMSNSEYIDLLLKRKAINSKVELINEIAEEL